MLRYWWLFAVALYLSALALYHYGPLLSLMWGASPAKRGRSYYRMGLRRLAAFGMRPGDSESPLEFAQRIESDFGVAFLELTNWYLGSIFQPPHTPIDDNELHSAVAGLMYSLRRIYSPLSRLLAAAVPWLSPAGFFAAERVGKSGSRRSSEVVHRE